MSDENQMIGMMLVTHGHLAEELIMTMEHVVGLQPCIGTICIRQNDDMEQHRLDILESVTSVSDRSGVVVLTDMFGGIPSNLAILIMNEAKV